MTIVIQDNLSEVLKTLSSKDVQKGTNRALKKVGSLVQREAKGELRRKVKITGKSKNSRKYGKMDKGIKSSVEGDEVKVHIMGDYRLKFFEKGTAYRKTRKGYNRGSITARPFFAPAVKSVEHSVKDLFDLSFENEVSRILARKGK